MASVTGGQGLIRQLEQMRRSLTNASSVRVGFLEDARYPDGTPVAMIAAIQDGGAPSVGIPPRPFFRNMIRQKRHEWGPAAAALLRENYDALRTLQQVGEGIAGQLRQSIIDTNSPPLAQSTIDRKGFDKPLVDTGHMLNSVNYEVSE